MLGVTPWDHEEIEPALADLVEGPNALTPGTALDLGCGTGTQAVYLATKGWQVTGIDYVPRALQKARQKAAAAKVAPTWIEGDVTRLPELLADRGNAYNLLLDFGCFHGLSATECAAYAAGINAVAAPGATFFLFSFAPGRRGPAPRGVSLAEIERYLGAKWELLWSRQASGQYPPPFLKNASPTLYCLHRR